ncbi:unnamed protein product, partial [Amoebophrya sp. A120]
AKNAKRKNTSTSTSSLGAATTGGSSSYSGPSRTLSSSTSSTGAGLSNDNKHQRILNYPLTPEVGPREVVLLEAPPIEKFDVATRPDGETGVLEHDREQHHAGIISSNQGGGGGGAYQHNGNEGLVAGPRGASSSRTHELRKNTSSTTSIKDLYNVVPASSVNDDKPQ